MGWKKVDPIASPLTHKMTSAVKAGGNDTLAAAAISAKQNHGWKNRTGTAEGSVRMQPVEQTGPTSFRGFFGSWDVFYFLFLELGTRFMSADYTLRRAADAEFPKVGRRIKGHLG